MAVEKIPLIYSSYTLKKPSGNNTDQDILNNRNGYHMHIDGFTVAQVNDANNTGVVGDDDTDDNTRAGGENWTFNVDDNVDVKVLKEVALYNNSKLFLLDGSEVQLDLYIFLFDDGTYGFSTVANPNKVGGPSPNDIATLDYTQIDYSKDIILGTQEPGEYTGVGTFNLFRDFLTCFTTDTLIMTRRGNVPVGELVVGDDVLTLDHGYQKIRWIGSRKVTSAELLLNEKLRPVRISAGALGSRLPARDLIVSRQHRVFVRSELAERVLGAREVLIPAIRLTMLEGVDVVETCRALVYWHILFDQHEVVFSEGYPTESLFTGPQALKALGPAAVEEIQTLFPEISLPDHVSALARPVPAKGKDVKKFITRSVKNGKPIMAD